MKKLISALLIGAIAASVCVTMASCGGNKDSKTETTAPTKASATAPATTAAQSQQNGETATQSDFQAQLQQKPSEYYQPATDYQGAAISDDKIHGGVWEQVAIQNAVQSAGYGAIAVGDYPGQAPDGLDCWVVTVKKADGSYVIYYSGLYFCYPEGGSSDSGSDSDSQDNGNNNYSGDAVSSDEEGHNENGNVYADADDEDNTVAPYNGE